MKRRSVAVARKAISDLDRIYEFIKRGSSALTARRYVDRIRRFLKTLGSASERGNDHGQYKVGLRSIGFEGKAQVVFEVLEHEVRITRIFYGGENWLSSVEDPDSKSP